MKRLLFLAVCLAGCGGGRAIVESAPPAMPEFRTVETCVTVRIAPSRAAAASQAGYLGVAIDGRLIIDVAADSPAAKAGLKAGDLLVEVGGEAVEDEEELRDLIHGTTPGDAVKVVVTRKGETLEVVAKVGAVSRPMQLNERRAILGVQLGDAAEGGGAPVTRVTRDSPAEKAGVKTGDVLLKIDDAAIASTAQLSDTLAAKSPGDIVTLAFERAGKAESLKVTLASDPAAEARAAGYSRGGSLWKKELYRLAAIGIEFSDVKHNEKIAPGDWSEELFSTGTYTKKSVTGQNVYGSLNDYYREQSCGALRVEGKMLGWVQVAKKRDEYAPGTGSREKNAFFTEVIDKLLEREGKDALKEFDGLFFVYAGGSLQTNRGGLYWPHRSSTTVHNVRYSYFIVPEGGARMTSISVIAHEFGHMLGLPDLYARPENPGSTGLGVWCAMSNQNGGGRPQHFCPWCKEQLGWLKPAVIDPSVKQRLTLAPILGSTKECYKVLVRPDGSEYLLLENRRKTGFDKDLPAEGLLIWRVVRGRPMIEESHGVDGPSGPGVFLGSIPYPSAANDAFTPYTTPSSRSQLGGGTPVHITNIRRMKEGGISFTIGFDYE